MREFLLYVSVAYVVVGLFVVATSYMLGTVNAIGGQEVLAEAAAKGFGWPWEIWNFLSASS